MHTHILLYPFISQLFIHNISRRPINSNNSLGSVANVGSLVVRNSSNQDTENVPRGNRDIEMEGN